MTLRPNGRAFLVGVLVHLVLLAFAHVGGALQPLATLLWLVLALPGALVDMSAEVLHPSKLGTVALVVAASVLNGSVYAAGVALYSRFAARKPPA